MLLPTAGMQRGGVIQVVVGGGGDAVRAEVLRALSALGYGAGAHDPEAVLLAGFTSIADQVEQLRVLRRERPEMPVLALRDPGDARGVMQLMGEGAYDCLPWPVDVPRLGHSLRRATEWRRLAVENQSLRQSATAPRPLRDALLVGTSPAMMDVYRVIAQVAPTSVPVLILGEEGSGRELVAKTIHERSGRGGAFVAARCEGGAEADFGRELFGDDTHPGLIEDAHRGTLFLDDIDALGPRNQAQLLRVIEERAVRRGGLSREVDLRLLTATDSDLSAESAEGRFREDLLFRLHVVTVQVPPLSARREDIPALVDHFAQHYAMVLGRPTPSLSADARESLLRNPWPGNLRQLARTLERAVLQARGDMILREDIEAAAHPGVEAPPEETEAWPTLASVERRYIDRVLEHTRGNKTRAAEVLGIDRRTLSRLFARERAERTDAPGGAFTR